MSENRKDSKTEITSGDGKPQDTFPESYERHKSTEKPEETAEKPDGVLAELTNQAKDVAATAIETAEEVVKQVVEKVSEVAEKAAEKVTEVKEKADTKLEERKDEELGPYNSPGTIVPSDFDPIAGMDIPSIDSLNLEDKTSPKKQD